MDIRGKRLVVIGGAGLIGSHTVDMLTREDVGEIVVYDNFFRGTHANLARALRDPRVKCFEAGGDICQTDILNAGLKNAEFPALAPTVAAKYAFRVQPMTMIGRFVIALCFLRSTILCILT